MTYWNDPAIDPPPFGRRILIRLSDRFRDEHKIALSGVQGYLVREGEPHMYGFSTVFGPHVTGWRALEAWPERAEVVDTNTAERLQASLAGIGAKLAERSAMSGYHLTKSQGEQT